MQFLSPPVSPAAPPVPENELARQAALDRYNILDTLPEQAFDDIVRLAAHICDMPIALVSLVDRDRQWFKARYGLDVGETPREQAFCAHAIADPDRPLVVPDATQDERFAGNPLVTGGPAIRFYAGTPLKTPDGYAIGTLCAIDSQPRELSQSQLEALEALGRQVVDQLESRRSVRQLADTLDRLQRAQAQLIHREKMSAMGQFVAGIAHEINNATAVIAGNATHARDYAREAIARLRASEDAGETGAMAAGDGDLQEDWLDDFPKALAAIDQGTRRIQRIVRSLRGFAHFGESGVKPIDLHANLDATLDLLHPQLVARDGCPPIRVTRRYGELPPVPCRVEDINQAFFGILSNAIEAVAARPPAACADAPGEIAIATAVSGDRARLVIADNGIGLTPKSRDRAFDAFFTTKPVGQGTGLGLTTAYRIVVEGHGGNLSLGDRSDGQSGCECVAELPLRTPPSRSSPSTGL